MKHTRFPLFRTAADAAPSSVLIGVLASLMISIGGCRSAEDAPEPEPDAATSENAVTPPDIARTAAQTGIALPTMVSLAPTRSEANVDPDTNVVIVFNVGMEVETTTNAITVIVNTKPVAGTTTYDAATMTLTFDPTASLPKSTVVTVQVAEMTSVQDILTQPDQWDFTTSD